MNELVLAMALFGAASALALGFAALGARMAGVAVWKGPVLFAATTAAGALIIEFALSPWITTWPIIIVLEIAITVLIAGFGGRRFLRIPKRAIVQILLGGVVGYALAVLILWAVYVIR